MAPMISELNELPQTIKTEHDQMLLEQFCLSLTDNIDQEQGQEVNQYVNLDMCSDEALQNRSQLAMGNTPTTESAFRIDQATMEKLSLTSTTPSELYPSPTIPMNSQSTDPALISYRTPSKSPMPVPTINGYAVSPGSINESYVPDWSSSTSLPGQSLFPDLGNSQAQASSPASVYNNLLVTAASQTTTPMYNAPVNMTTNTYLTSSSNMVQPTNMGRIEINANPQGAEPCNIRMNYIDEGGFVDVNVDHIADQLSGLSVADNGVQPSAPRPASSSASAVTHHSVSMPEPQIYRGNEASSYGARASSTAAAATSVRKTVVDYKTREEHKALIETLLKRISVLFQKQEEKTNSSRARRQDDTSSHWQLLDSHGGSSTSQEVN
ncbi:hypothetical protein BDF22DRAFT_652388 [Syncephalis plumigaleata]|nr:hypothetical protein BDF22DRAFT_652388 [Syncephalis plumigaleata]